MFTPFASDITNTFRNVLVGIIVMLIIYGRHKYYV